MSSVRIPYAPSYLAWLRGNRMVARVMWPSDIPEMEPRACNGCVHRNQSRGAAPDTSHTALVRGAGET